MPELSHVDDANQPRMVDVSEKNVTLREATARSIVVPPPEVTALLDGGDIHGKKGPVFQTAIIAGTLAVKRTHDLIPLCHPLPIEDCHIQIAVNGSGEIVVECRVRVHHRTGVEMEALMGASIAALTIYDMCKAVSHNIVIKETRLIRKSGGNVMSMFHPFEIAVCGYSGSGKTTLVVRLLEHFSSTFRVGYIKHSGHDFEMDRDGKDTSLARMAGAARVFISNDRRTAVTTEEAVDFVQQRTMFSDCDFVLAEGWKQSLLPRIVVLDEKADIMDEVLPDSGPVLAVVGYTDSGPSGDAPYRHRDDVEGIAALLSDYLAARTEATPIKGLVLAGGKSSRMKRDKASLEYGGQTQLSMAFDLVAACCAEAYVSCRREQGEGKPFNAFKQVHDRYLECGPTGGILSAMALDPAAAWLVVACDLPFIDRATLGCLLRHRQPLKIATAYTSANDGLPEPLCAIYEPHARSRLLQFMAIGYTCPRKVLLNSNTALLPLENVRALDNVNHPDEYAKALEALKE